MEKRIVIFGLLSMAIVIGYSSLQLAIFGRPDPIAKVAEDDIGGRPVADADAAVPADEGEPADDAAMPGEVGVPAADDREAEEGAAPADEAAAIGEKPEPDEPIRLVSLGSLDPASGQSMLVTYTNQGAAIVRIELNSPRYRDLYESRGYLGHLACTDDPAGGCRIGVVGAGTPAALAVTDNGPVGLQGPRFETDENGRTRIQRLGDRIVEFEGEPINGVADWERALDKTRPGQEVTISVQRPNDDGDGQRLNFETKLIKRPLEVIRPEQGADQPRDPLSYLLSLARIDDRSIGFGENEIDGVPSLQQANWAVNVDHAKQAVEFRRQLTSAELQAVGIQGALEIVKRFSLMSPANPAEQQDAKGFLILFDIEIHNRGDAEHVVSYQLDGPTGLPLEGWWYSSKVHPSKWGAAGRGILSGANSGKNSICCPPATSPSKPRTLRTRINRSSIHVIPFLCGSSARMHSTSRRSSRRRRWH